MNEKLIRGLSDQTMFVLKGIAKKRGVSLNRLIIDILDRFAVEPQLLEMDIKYRELTGEVIKALHVNTKALQEFNSLNNDLFLEEQED